jgi:hypothetical protein
MVLLLSLWHLRVPATAFKWPTIVQLRFLGLTSFVGSLFLEWIWILQVHLLMLVYFRNYHVWWGKDYLYHSPIRYLSYPNCSDYYVFSRYTWSCPLFRDFSYFTYFTQWNLQLLLFMWDHSSSKFWVKLYQIPAMVNNRGSYAISPVLQR